MRRLSPSSIAAEAGLSICFSPHLCDILTIVQEALIGYFQRIATPGLDAAAEAVTMLGEEYFIIAVVCLVYWNLSRKEGFKLAAVFIFSSILDNVLKITFRSSRPFEKLDFIQGKRLETATGYSFPSSHSQGAAALFTSAALHVGKWWAAAAVAIVTLGLFQLRNLHAANNAA